MISPEVYHQNRAIGSRGATPRTINSHESAGGRRARPVTSHVVFSTVVAAVLDVHKAWSWVMILGNAFAGLWSLGAHRFASLRTRSLWWFTVAVELSVFVQVILCVWMVNKQKVEPPQFHLFYGFIGIIAIGILYAYRVQLKHRLYLLYGFGGLFIMGLGIRAMLVGQRTIGE